MFDLTGKVALVTGASGGIGGAIAKALHAQGATVVLSGTRAEALEKVKADLGSRAFVAVCNLADKESVEALPKAAEAAAGAPIDILVNNAGMQLRGPIVDYPEEDWRRIMATNLDSVFFLSQSVARRMLPRGRGKIINICSVMSELGRATIAPYTASKGAVKMLTKAMCAEWGKHNIQANGISPGYFATELNQTLIADEKFSAWVCARTPQGRWGRVEELQGAAIFLASDASSFVNGNILFVDGGMTAVV
jgi:gluconate 5-dehydrogenase